MGTGVVVGLDIAKSVFQVHGVDRDGAVVRRPFEAVRAASGCACSASNGS